MPNPEAFLAHLREAGYHPRSNKHSDVLAGCIVDDPMHYDSFIQSICRQYSDRF